MRRQALMLVQVAGRVVALRKHHPLETLHPLQFLGQQRQVPLIVRHPDQRGQSGLEGRMPLCFKSDAAAVEGMVLRNAQRIRVVLGHPRVGIGQQPVAVGVRPRAFLHIADVVDRIPAEAVQPVFLQEHPHGIENERPDFGAAEIGAGAPWRGGALGVAVEIDAPVACGQALVELPGGNLVGAVVVVHDVQQDGNAVGMAGANEGPEGVGAAVRRLDGEEIRRIVAPGAVAGEFVDRHELDAVDSQRLQVGQAPGGALKQRTRSRHPARKGAQMHFVHHQAFARRHLPALGRPPGKSARIQNHPRVFFLVHGAGARIPPLQTIQHKPVGIARTRAAAVQRPVSRAGRFRPQRLFFPPVEFSADLHGTGIRRPHAKRHEPSGPLALDLRAHRHLRNALGRSAPGRGQPPQDQQNGKQAMAARLTHGLGRR